MGADRPEEVAVARRVRRDLARAIAEELAAGIEPQRHELVEDGRLAETELGDMGADGLVGREARHQCDRQARLERALEGDRLLEFHLEEALAVDGWQDRLHDATEPRGHPTREHDLGDLAAAKRLDAGCVGVVVSGLAGIGQARQVLRTRRFDLAADEIRLRRQLP